MPYKDPEAKRRYMTQYYQQKIKTGEIPCTAHRKGSYGLTRSLANKTQVVGTSRLMTEPHVVPTNLTAKPAYLLKRESKKPTLPRRSGGAEYREPRSERMFRQSGRWAPLLADVRICSPTPPRRRGPSVMSSSVVGRNPGYRSR